MDHQLKDSIYSIVDAFCDERITEEKIRNWCESRGIPSAEYDAFYASELGNYCLPTQFGGYEGPFAARALLMARLTRRAAAALPYLTDMNSMALLSTMRSLSQQEIVEDLGQHDGRVAFSQAFSEGGLQTDSSSISTEVTADGDALYLNGVKTYVANGQFVANTLVLAHDTACGAEDGGNALWLVPINQEGVYTYPIESVGQEMLAPARIEFDHVRLNPDWQIQTEGRLTSMLDRQYELGRILICATSLGLAQAAMDDALLRCATYRSGGRYLGNIPQVETKLANMAASIRSMEGLVLDAAESVSRDDSASEQRLNCALMKLIVPKAATDVASEALQIFGGAGYTTEARVGRIWRDCRGMQIAQGSDEMMVHPVAKQLLKLYPGTLKDY